MSFVAAGAALVSAGVGVYKAVQGKKAADAAAIEADKARVQMDKQRAKFEQLDTSNPYLNMENTLEDMTVNQQQADFEKQQAMQSQANIMGQMRGAAGSSGIAALAQTLANQGALSAQEASKSIGEQETANQQAILEEESRLQGLEREGEVMSRDMEAQKTQSLLALSAGDVSSAQALQQQGMDAMSAGIQQAGSGLVSGVSGTVGGIKDLQKPKDQ